MSSHLRQLMYKIFQLAKHLRMKWGKSPAKNKDSPEVPETSPMTDINYVICDSSASFAKCVTSTYGIIMLFHRKVELMLHADYIKIY